MRIYLEHLISIDHQLLHQGQRLLSIRNLPKEIVGRIMEYKVGALDHHYNITDVLEVLCQKQEVKSYQTQ